MFCLYETYSRTKSHIKASGGDSVVVRGLVIDKVYHDVPFYVGLAYCEKCMTVDDHGNLQFGRHACEI